MFNHIFLKESAIVQNLLGFLTLSHCVIIQKHLIESTTVIQQWFKEISSIKGHSPYTDDAKLACITIYFSIHRGALN